MNKFCKLYETEECGQVLVMLDSGDEGPEVRFYFQPVGLGVCAQKLGFTYDDAGWDKAEKAFEKVDEAIAIELVTSLLANIPVFGSE